MFFLVLEHVLKVTIIDFLCVCVCRMIKVVLIIGYVGQNRCVNMIANLFNAPVGDAEAAVGVGTIGSSEAIMLAGLAFKRKWQQKMKAQGKPYDKPNIVTGANVQVRPILPFQKSCIPISC